MSDDTVVLAVAADPATGVPLDALAAVTPNDFPIGLLRAPLVRDAYLVAARGCAEPARVHARFRAALRERLVDVLNAIERAARCVLGSYAAAHALCGGRSALHEEVVAKLQLALFEGAAHFDPARGDSVEGWLCGVARNLCRDELRRAARRAARDVTECAPATGTEARRPELSDLVRALFARLRDKPHLRRVFVLLYRWEYSMKDAAQRLGLKLGTLYKQREALVELLRATGLNPFDTA